MKNIQVLSEVECEDIAYKTSVLISKGWIRLSKYDSNLISDFEKENNVRIMDDDRPDNKYFWFKGSSFTLNKRMQNQFCHYITLACPFMSLDEAFDMVS